MRMAESNKWVTASPSESLDVRGAARALHGVPGQGKTMTVDDITTFVCEKCREPFDPMHGGICRVCKRLLCHEHLIGLGTIRFRPDKGQPVCPECSERAGRPGRHPEA